MLVYHLYIQCCRSLKMCLSEIKGFKAKLRVMANAVPRFLRARPIPFALKDALGKELDKLWVFCGKKHMHGQHLLLWFLRKMVDFVSAVIVRSQ